MLDRLEDHEFKVVLSYITILRTVAKAVAGCIPARIPDPWLVYTRNYSETVFF